MASRGHLLRARVLRGLALGAKDKYELKRWLCWDVLTDHRYLDHLLIQMEAEREIIKTGTKYEIPAIRERKAIM